MRGQHSEYKEVRFDKYCKKCIHRETSDAVDPCDSCLRISMREGTFKPENYIPKEEEKKEKGGCCECQKAQKKSSKRS